MMYCCFCSAPTPHLGRIYFDDGTVGAICADCANEADRRRPIFDEVGEAIEYVRLGRDRGAPSPWRYDDDDAAAWAHYRASLP